ncbi:unnamed protein product [Calicophoron daubneyi]|uniref:Nuclear export mediator factor NEMF n=1 Tax=Calicophoron daubneyi TaxID=300641 RepID=A0AAV2TAQ2_CALDB
MYNLLKAVNKLTPYNDSQNLSVVRDSSPSLRIHIWADWPVEFDSRNVPFRTLNHEVDVLYAGCCRCPPGTSVVMSCLLTSTFKSIVGHRVNNVYDANNKLYLLKLSCTETGEKVILLLESGARIHLSEYEWQKNDVPSGFSMKLRKHIRNRKISCVRQLGMDRIVDIEIGFGELCYHLIVELYDRGNMCLTDHTYTILHLLRPRTDATQDVRYAAHEKYPVELARQAPDCLCSFPAADSKQKIYDYILSLFVKESDEFFNPETGGDLRHIQKIFSSEFAYGQAAVEHCCRLAHAKVMDFIKARRTGDCPMPVNHQKIREEYSKYLTDTLHNLLLHFCTEETGSPRGYIFGKKKDPQDEKLLDQQDFQPFLFEQLKNKPYVSYETFNKAVDVFFSSLESQKTTEKCSQNEKKANKKLENIKRDHEIRLANLKADQELDVRKAHLLEANQQLVDNVILMINHALSNQLDWRVLENMVEEARSRNDPLASHIVELNLRTNQFTIRLSYPYDEAVGDGEEKSSESTLDIVLDLGLNALNNARKYYDKKRAAVKKEERTLIASAKALKSAARKAQETRKEIRKVQQITKARKPLWFEKFFWFVTSENYLVVAGHDSLQNEVLVKRYFEPDDIYVHADIHGASSVIVKARPLQPEEHAETTEPSTDRHRRLPLPPQKTLMEAGVMAVVLSSAWNARVITNAWWVYQNQVSKTAQSGEYLTTGAFVIRGRKNYLPPCQLVYGFGVLFKLDDESSARHRSERRIVPSEETLRPAVKSDENEGAVETDDSKTFLKEDPDEPEDAEDLSPEFPNAQLKLDLARVPTRVKGARNRIADSADPIRFNTLSEDASKRKRSNQQPDKGGAKSHPSADHPQPSKSAQSIHNAGPLKRGQKSKLKKIKQKYGEQDDEEREIRMKILQGDAAKVSQHHKRLDAVGFRTFDSQEGSDDDADKQSSSSDEAQSSELSPLNSQSDISHVPAAFLKPVPEQKREAERNDSLVERLGKCRILDEGWFPILNTLTGQPDEEDVLLYALPVCAPYSTLANYKFKVKLTPGTSKRGKAVKTTLNAFAMGSSTTAREKELIRALKEEDVSRNFLNFVKLTFPQMKNSRG